MYKKTFTQPTESSTSVENIQPGLDLYKNALTKEQQKEFYKFGKSVLEQHGYNPFPGYVMASAGQMEWSPEMVVDKKGKLINRGENYNKKITSHKKKVKGTDGAKGNRFTYHYYLSNLDGSGIIPIPANIINSLEKITGQNMSDYDTVLINLYPIGRTLGWHVDVSEDYRNLDRDIISVSIGADADFHYANTPDNFISGTPAKEEKPLNLKSGDVVSFGGKSRLISHTVKNVTGSTDLGSINLSNSNVNNFFKGGLSLDNWRMNFTFRVADPVNNKGKKVTTQSSTNVESKTSITEITNAIKNQLPVEISNTVTVIQDVPLDILGRDDLFLSLKEILNDNNVKNEILINWAGINKDAINIKSIKSEQQLEKIINSVYDKKKDVNSHPELKINKLALESFDKWVNALEKFPIAFKEVMLTHAIKQLNPKRRSKYVLQLSDVALTQAYGIVVNKPHELNRIGKLYDQEVLKTVSDAVGHEPSASGEGYWVHIPRTKNTKFTSRITDVSNDKNAPGKFYVEYLEKGIEDSPDIDFFETREEAENFIKTLEPDNNSAQFKVNVELLRKLSPSTWCTASGMASHYVENYDNYLLIVNGITVAGIEATSEYTSNNSKLENELKGLKYVVDSDGGTIEDRERIIAIESFLKNADTKKRKVKEVTSRGNNGVASIDHYDDIYAFFEKHNLDTNNSTLQRAKKAKDAGKVDAEVFRDIDDEAQQAFYEDQRQRDLEERIAIDQYNGEFEYDEPNQDDYYDEMGRQHDAERDRVSFFNSIDEVKANIDLAIKHFYELKEEFQNNEEIATIAVLSDAHNISQINSALPFYNELAKKAIQKTPYVYTYLSLEAQQIPEIKKIYEEYLRLDADLPFSKTNTNQIQGYYDAKNDKVIVVASNTPINEAAKVAIHEVAHRGMVRMAKDLGGTKELNQILLNSEYELMKKLPELLKRTGHESLKSLMLDYGFTTESEEGKVKLLSELAARWAETLVNKPKPSWWKDFLTSIQKWITKFTGKILNEKEVNELVGGFVKYGTEVNQTNTKFKPSNSVEKNNDYNRAFNLTLNESLKENLDYSNPGSENATVSDIITRMPIINDKDIEDTEQTCKGNSI